MQVQSGDIIGDYIIVRSLSRQGGMSRVFLAHEIHRPKYLLALKINLTEDENSSAYRNFLRREVSVLKRLRHPNIVRIFPISIEDKIVYSARATKLRNAPSYFTMEYIGGGSLGSHVDLISRKFSIEWGIELFYQLLITVNYVHSLGFAHCDLKPANILFRYSPKIDELPSPLLIDFGSVAEMGQISRLTASIMYAPPEVVRYLNSGTIDNVQNVLSPEKIDVWSLGVILFEILTGKPLFAEDEQKNITTRILRGKLEQIQSYRPEAPRSLDTMLQAMLRPSPSDRPTISTVIEAIEERISNIRPPRILTR